MIVTSYWKSGRKYFELDLGDGNALMSVVPTKGTRLDLDAYGASQFPRNKVYYVEYVRVSKPFRNNGYGKLLLRECIKWASNTKTVLILDAIPMDGDVEQYRLIQFYLDMGFKRTSGEHSMCFNPRKPTGKLKV